jgi:hypothetical protein
MSGPSKAGQAPAPEDEWPATRMEPQPAAGVDPWQPTRVMPRPRDDARPAAGALEPSPAAARYREAPDAWASTRAQTALATQVLGDEEYLAVEQEVGRQIGNNERELFVSCAPAEAMQQQFEHLQPDFIAVHDIATQSSRKLLAGIAAASGQSTQKLFIRRQGYGTPLATLEFVELPASDGRTLRLYTTEADADTPSRHALAKILLGYSRLAVVMVGDLPGHAIAGALKPLNEDILAGPWPSRHLLILPLGSASQLGTHATDLGRGTGVTVRTTPQVARPADAWSFITATWGRIRDMAEGAEGPRAQCLQARHVQPEAAAGATGLPSGDTLPMEDPAPKAASAPLDLLPMPQISLGAPPSGGSAPPAAPVASAHARAASTASVLDRYVRAVAELNGVVSAAIFEVSGGRAVAHAGASPSAPELGQHGAALLAVMSGTSRALGFGHLTPEAAVTLGSHHLLLRAVPKQPGLALHAVLDKTSANLTLARLQVQRLDSLFDGT